MRKRVNRPAVAGVLLMAVAACLSAVDAALVRVLGRELHPLLIAFTRSLFGLAAVAPWILRRPAMLRSDWRLMHVLRAAAKLGSLVAFFAAYAAAPLADVMALAFAAPLFVTVGAWLVLRERPVPLRVGAVLIGFVGVLIVLHPGSGALDPALGFALLGALLTAVIQLMLRPMAQRDGTDTLVAWNLILTVPLALAVALWAWEWPTPAQWGLLALQGTLGALNMTIVTRAFSLAEAQIAAPMEFLRLPAVAVLGWLLFSEVVGVRTWIGAVVIFGGIILMTATLRERKQRPLPEPSPGAEP